MDPDSVNSLGYKALVAKLSSFAKFEIDTKIDIHQFYKLLEEMSSEVVE